MRGSQRLAAAGFRPLASRLLNEGLMCVRILLFLAGWVLFAADRQQTALELRAQTDFDRVVWSIPPQIQDADRCIQSQVAAITVANPSGLSTLYFQEGFCRIAEATITQRPADFLEAAAILQKSIDAWPEAAGRIPKNYDPPPVPSGLHVLAGMVKLQTQPDAGTINQARHEISGSMETPACISSVMPPNLCQSILGIGRQWLGWAALQRDDLLEASRLFSERPESAWSLWTAGLVAAGNGNERDATVRFRQALETWKRAQNDLVSVVGRLAPKPDMPRALLLLGSTEILTGDPAAAATTLDAAVKADPTLVRAIYLRARAEELSGKSEQALADYSLASRTAFANTQDLASGEAHLYRGIQFYRRKDYPHAEDEFGSALNFAIPPDLLPDAEAWRHMAALAGGACGESRVLLEDLLGRCSPYFPKQEARALAAACPLSAASAPVNSPAR
jgi:tetratricopeptide (TPR) repeat protein